MLLLLNDKSSFMKVMEELPTQNISGVGMDNAESAVTNSTRKNVCITDGVGVVQSIKKGASMMSGLCQLFCSTSRTNAVGCGCNTFSNILMFVILLSNIYQKDFLVEFLLFADQKNLVEYVENITSSCISAIN